MITLTYNGDSIANEPNIGMPYVSFSVTPHNNADRVTVSKEITLNGKLLDGNASSLFNFFKESFGTLIVEEGGKVILSAATVIVESISIEKSKMLVGVPLNYSVKLKAYDSVSSTVLDPSNEISYKEDESGVISVTQKISAKGIKLNGKLAIENAKNFVLAIIATAPANPFLIYTPMKVSWAGGQKAALVSKNETVDRLNGIYTVTREWKYSYEGCIDISAGSGIMRVSSATINESDEAESTTAELDVEFTGGLDTSQQDLRDAVASIMSGGPDDKKNADTRALLLDRLTDILGGFNIADFYQTSFNIEEGARSIKLKVTYTKGILGSDLEGNFNLPGNLSNIAGYFQLHLSIEKDEITSVSTYTIGGDFVCNQPIARRREEIDKFKKSVGLSSGVGVAGQFAGSRSVCIAYLRSLILNDPMYAALSGPWSLNFVPEDFRVSENFEKATFSMSAKFSDEDSIPGCVKSSYEVSAEASIRERKEIHSANVDGHILIQDLNCITSQKTSTRLNGVYNVSAGFPVDLIVAKSFAQALENDTFIKTLGGVTASFPTTSDQDISSTSFSFNRGYISRSTEQFCLQGAPYVASCDVNLHLAATMGRWGLGAGKARTRDGLFGN